MGASGINVTTCNCNNNKPNPDPKNFVIKKIDPYAYGWLIALVDYPSCTNYEGLKVLVFKGVTEEELKEAEVLDPHFCEDCKLSPIARFRPDELGVSMAKLLVTSALREEYKNKYK